MTEIQERNVGDLVEQANPAPGFRENQKQVTEAIVKAFGVNDRDLVILDAPTGFGKSLVNYLAMDTTDGDWFYVTPLKSLQDQLTEDDLFGDDVIEIKGRSNYPCILPDEDTTVDKAKCQRESDFDCHMKDECPYYVQKANAMNHDKSVMNLSYMMAEGFVPDMADNKFDDRYGMIIDECQTLPSWAMNYVQTTFSKRAVPEEVWNNVRIPRERELNGMEDAIEWIEEEVAPTVREVQEYLNSVSIKSEDELDDQEKLSQFSDKVNRFLRDQQDHHWVYDIQTEVRKNKSNTRKMVFKPIKVGRFLEDLIWNRSEKVVLSSATIPKGDFLQEVGLEDKDAIRLNVPSPFPVENRPIITGHAVGKMTKSERDKVAPKMARKIKQIADHHEGEKGFVHCRGYNIAKLLRRSFFNNGMRDWFKENVMVQDRFNREESLQKWKESDTQVFFSVNMAEGIDLEGDACRWQALAKVLYPFMGDERVKYRVQEMNDWTWYNNKAVVQIEQAYGRAVRSRDDEAVFYILDKSGVGLLQRNSELFHDFFLEAVDDMKV